MYYNQKGKDAGHSLMEKIGRDQIAAKADMERAEGEILALQGSLAALGALVSNISVRLAALEKKKKKDD